MGSLCVAGSANRRAQCTCRCEVVIGAWPMASCIENTPALPRAVRVPRMAQSVRAEEFVDSRGDPRRVRSAVRQKRGPLGIPAPHCSKELL
jgi:hypothetical protein